MKINNNIFSGMLSGLICGTILDILFGTVHYWIVFSMIGIQSGIILKQKKEFNDLILPKEDRK